MVKRLTSSIIEQLKFSYNSQHDTTIDQQNLISLAKWINKCTMMSKNEGCL